MNVKYPQKRGRQISYVVMDKMNFKIVHIG